jgi:hypothetical protein
MPAPAEHGFDMPSSDIGFFEGIVRDLTSGKGQLRFIIQPLVAIFLGARLGVADAREGQRPFLLRLFHREHRAELFKQSLSDIVMPLGLGIIIDAILQHYTLGFIRPLHAVVVGLLIVWVPYSFARAITNRIVRHRHHARAG